MPELHAQLSPSSAERWFTCPGSVVLSEGMPSRTSAHAEEGTLAHSIAEAALRGEIVPQSEMLTNLLPYIEHVQDHCGPDCELFIEKRVSVTPQTWGTADAIVWNPNTETLHVVDLKYGAGVGVEVRGNLQLKIYGLGALLSLPFRPKIVNVGIAQPRYQHSDGVCRSVDYATADLVDFHADLLDATSRFEQAVVKCGVVSPDS